MVGSRDPHAEELREWLAGEGHQIESGTLAGVAEFGELLVLAVLGTAAEEAISRAGPERFGGKIVIDTMNPLDFSEGMPPRPAISVGRPTSAQNQIFKELKNPPILSA